MCNYIKIKYINIKYYIVSLQLDSSANINGSLQSGDPEAWQQLAEAMTPSIVKVVEFAKGVPGFVQV